MDANTGSPRRFVVDTNQVASIVRMRPADGRPAREIQLVLPEFVQLEILAANDRTQRIAGLAQYDLRFGIDQREIVGRMAALPALAIPSFDTVHSLTDPEHDQLLAKFVLPSLDRIGAAKSLKKMSSHFNRRLMEDHKIRRKSYRDEVSRGRQTPVPQIANLEDLEAFLERASERVRSLYAPNVTDQKVQDAILRHPLIHREILYTATLEAGEAKRLSNRSLHRLQISEGRNDFTDNTLAIYTGDRDVVVSNDRAVQDVFRFISNGSIAVLTWEECMDRYFGGCA